jgi:hypothetical protein
MSINIQRGVVPVELGALHINPLVLAGRYTLLLMLAWLQLMLNFPLDIGGQQCTARGLQGPTIISHVAKSIKMCFFIGESIVEQYNGGFVLVVRTWYEKGGISCVIVDDKIGLQHLGGSLYQHVGGIRAALCHVLHELVKGMPVQAVLTRRRIFVKRVVYHVEMVKEFLVVAGVLCGTFPQLSSLFPYEIVRKGVKKAIAIRWCFHHLHTAQEMTVGSVQIVYWTTATGPLYCVALGGEGWDRPLGLLQLLLLKQRLLIYHGCCVCCNSLQLERRFLFCISCLCGRKHWGGARISDSLLRMQITKKVFLAASCGRKNYESFFTPREQIPSQGFGATHTAVFATQGSKATQSTHRTRPPTWKRPNRCTAASYSPKGSSWWDKSGTARFVARKLPARVRVERLR